MSLLHWVTYRGLSPRGERHFGNVDALVSVLSTRHHIRTKLSSPGFSPTKYLDHYTVPSTESHGEFAVDAPSVWRCNEGVRGLSAWVGDLDHAEPDWPRLKRSGNLVVCYTTPSHNPQDDPHWRIVAPSAGHIDAEHWPAVHAAGVDRFAPNADPSCSDASRFYFLCSGPAERDHVAEIRIIDGEPWQPDGAELACSTSVALDNQPLVTVDPDRAATDLEKVAAQRILKATCRKLSEWSSGGRQVRAYGTARYVGHLIAAGALNEPTAKRALWGAVSGEGSNCVGDEREAEVKRALRRGLARGVADGAYDFAVRVLPTREVHYG
jgi:hypothetical protein